MKKILFVTPFGGLTGSEMMLKYIIEGLKNSGVECVLACNRDGELLKDFPCRTYHLPIRDGIPTSLGDRFYNRINLSIQGKSLSEKYWQKVLDDEKPDLVYFNTIHINHFDFFFKNPSAPYVVHVHELPFALAHIIGYERSRLMFEKAQTVVACSKAVEDMLKSMQLKKIVLLHEAVDLNRVPDEKSLIASRNRIRQELGVKPDEFLWVMAGTADYRKGLDLAAPTIAKLKGAKLLWISSSAQETGLDYLVQKQMAELNNKDKVFQFSGHKREDYYQWLNAGDGFVLFSREDPFPLVMIEAAVLGMPIAAFNSGGVKEFVLNEMGTVVDGLQPNALAEAMQSIMSGATFVSKDTLKNRALEFTTTKQTTKWRRLILGQE